MSYCRFSNGDVYMFWHVDGFIQCCACKLSELVHTIWTKDCTSCEGNGCSNCMMNGSINFKHPNEAITHLEKHMESDHKVPAYAISRLKEDIVEWDKTY